nr:hypothetical protein BN993_01339 [Virgibacillus halodenitrificans]
MNALVILIIDTCFQIDKLTKSKNRRYPKACFCFFTDQIYEFNRSAPIVPLNRFFRLFFIIYLAISFISS